MATIKKTALIIGAGTGGYPCAIRLGQLGVDAMLVEKAEPGGVCLNWGCIPSKALISATKLYHKAQHAEHMGVSFQSPSVDMPKMQGWKAGIIKKLTGGVKTLVKGAGTEYVTATAEILGPGRVKLVYPKDEKGVAKPDDIVECEHLVIATGSQPIVIPGFEIDQDKVRDSTGALELDFVPEHMVCIGGGIIGLELGQTFQRLGTKLTVLEGMDRVLGPCDADLAKLVARKIKQDGGEVVTKAMAKGYETREGKLWVRAEVGGETKEYPADVVLVAVGRRPVTKGFGLERLGVTIDERGFVSVDARQQTNVAKVYAVGDVCGQPMLAHKASHEGEVVAEVIAGKKTVNDARSIPNVVFTEPEIASAGMGEDEARAAGHEIEIGKFPFSISGRAMAIDETDGFVKVIIDKQDTRVLGIHVVGPEASDLISEGSLAIEMGAFAEDIALTIHPHPTLGEAVMEAAKHAIGEAIHVGNRRR
ncbi:dihydrolipoyl dehydrogenase [Pseudenhygromyxa sp. WMMC2535]|uniref:dihydrolipoyl dehydrogenase n=1 Tax=Pseudenhygromyxa sp. WMMC2535 TaxID=2712867 RepID=UPI001557E616|nr:dihydrolipoyl dehydrogenase [Pseudenhygromyxa sp. WMMC2535]NVB36925.1 dihydrolipoyl dehydrogenase [Pseudenhygromyxa sp. WMMC2535]